MGEKYLGQLTAKSAPATGDILVLEDSEDTKKIDYDALANAILNKLTTKTYTVAGGTNTLIAAIDALNSKETLNITASTGTWPSEVTLQDTSYAYRLGSIVMVHINLKIVSTTKKNLVIGSVLPVSMRPKFSVFAMGGDGDTDGICQPFMIRSDGKISMWNTKTGTTYLQADATYIAKSGT